MLLAIDIGNSKAAFGLWASGQWLAIQQWPTESIGSNSELIEWLNRVKSENDELRVFSSSVKPSSESELRKAVLQSLGTDVQFLRSAEDFGIASLYSSELGSDRLANLVSALEQFQPPLIVVDIGTATTIDALDKDCVHVGGVIIAGPQFSIDALIGKSDLLNATRVRSHETIFSLNTADALSNGHFRGHLFALEGIIESMKSEIQGTVSVVTTGGLGKMFCDASTLLGQLQPTLTLDGIRIAGDRQSAQE